VKIVGILGCNGLDHCDDAPIRAHGGQRPRPTFLGGCAQCVRAYMMWKFNAIQYVLEHMMNNITL
jgi:hypothetical protein